eukprot:TRINITY_DN5352_c0_g1_i1.p1 TRINITY_DN5352_c0_g1~~TRINITY_DN5352_c0_g1_i1.p1  ORF type:complete len:382 (-),score=50.83 TRINITY_DN5352_c0_g1_i1:515-1510(-)
MLDTVDLDHNQTIDFYEFNRVFSQLHHISKENVLNYWSHLAVDNGSDFNVPVPNTTDKTGLWKFFIAGAAGGTTSRTLTAPLERLKVLAQVQTEQKSMITNIRAILDNEGIKGFYRGNAMSILRGGLYTGCVCYSFTWLLKYFNNRDLSDPVVKMTAGAMAGIFATTLSYPLDLMHTRLAGSSTKSVKTLFFDTISKEGASALAKGLLPTLLVIAPFVAVDKVFYTSVKKYFNENHPEIHPLFMFFSCASIAAISATSVTHPMDLVRKRLQMQGQEVQYSYKGMSDAIKHIIRTEGIKGMYKGILPSYLKVIPSVSASYIALEYTLTRLKN